MSKKRLEYWKIGFIWLTSTLALSACDSPLVKTAPNTTAEVIAVYSFRPPAALKLTLDDGADARKVFGS